MATEEHAVLADADLAEGQLKAVEVGKTKVLLARDGGTVYATAAMCPHYGLPLEKGMVCAGRLRCPFHESAFDLATGEVREPPALDGLATYPVRVDGGQIYVTVDDGKPAHVPPANRGKGTDARSVVILGGGAAGNAAAEALREFGFAGAITMVTADPKRPYDRPSLSKTYLSGQKPADKLPLRDEAFYADRSITVAHRSATGVDVRGRRVTFADGGAMPYHTLLLAVGGTPKGLGVPGGDRPNVLTLRTWADADRILSAVRKGARVAVVGASFIGMEVAAWLIQRGANVTVVAPSAVPFAQLGPRVGTVFLTMHEAKGVLFRMNARVAAVDDEGLVLQSGERVPADVILVGVGVRPATDFLPAEWVGEDGAIAVDENLQVPGTEGTVYAAGDIAKYPDWMAGGEPTRIEHWRLAEQHGRHAAGNMVGRITPFREVPFFWTNQYGQSMDYVGHATRPDETIIDGDLTGGKWIAYYLKDGRVAAAAGLQRKGDVMALMEVMRRVGRPSADGVRRGTVDWAKELETVGCATPTIAG